MFSKKEFYLSKIKKILIKKKYKVNKDQKKIINKDFISFYYTAIAGIFLIFFFSLTSKTALLTAKIFYDPATIENTSKLDFERILIAKKESDLKLEEKEKKVIIGITY